jgi:hypothetical protein
MTGMKVTLSAAMRARDVSRPRDEHLTGVAGDGAAREDTSGDAAVQQARGEIRERSARQTRQRPRRHR